MTVEDGLLPNETVKKLDGVDLTGFSDNYWIGLSLLHTLFVKEHNAICDHLRGSHPTWDDEQLFLTARLVNSALMAKIHTVEWTPGILANPVLERAMHANWYGILPQWVRQNFGHVGTEMIGGVVGSDQEHHAAPYAITEEFVSVYRLHPLLPDDYEIRDHRNGQLLARDRLRPDPGAGTRRLRQAGGGRTSSTRSAPPTPARSRSTTTRWRSPTMSASTASGSTWGRSTSFATASAASPATTTSARSCASGGSSSSTTSPTTRVGEGDRGRLRRRHRPGRPSGRDAGRAAAARVRLQRHRLPDLHPDGVAAAAKRPLLHQRLLARGLHPGGHRWVEEQHDGRRAAAPPPRARPRAGRRRERLRPLDKLA